MLQAFKLHLEMKRKQLKFQIKILYKKVFCKVAWFHKNILWKKAT